MTPGWPNAMLWPGLPSTTRCTPRAPSKPLPACMHVQQACQTARLTSKLQQSTESIPHCLLWSSLLHSVAGAAAAPCVRAATAGRAQETCYRRESLTASLFVNRVFGCIHMSDACMPALGHTRACIQAMLAPMRTALCGPWAWMTSWRLAGMAIKPETCRAA